jgi:hypothetical protein
MSLNPRFKYGLLVAAPVMIAITALAWSGSSTANNNHYYFNNQDTIPAKHHPTHKQLKEIREEDEDQQWSDSDHSMECFDEDIEDADFESINEQVERALQKVDEQIEQLHLQIDPETLRDQINESLQDIDVENINEEIEDAVQQALENVDINEIESEIRRSLNDALKEIEVHPYS